MKLHILSDLHNEFGEYVPNLAASKADVINLQVTLSLTHNPPLASFSEAGRESIT